MGTQKRNVAKFNQDVRENRGYRYTTNAPFSSRVANARITAATLDAVPPGTGSLIDIGCGDGTYTHDIKVRSPGTACTGVDPAAEAVAAARTRFPGVEFLVGDLLDPATFPARRFDVAVLRGVIHHIPDPATGIANAARLADALILIEPNGNNPVLKWLEKHSRYHVEHEEQSFTSRRLEAWCRQGGWRVERLRYIGFVPFFFPAWPARLIYLLQPLLERIPPLGRYLGAQVVLVCRR